MCFDLKQFEVYFFFFIIGEIDIEVNNRFLEKDENNRPLPEGTIQQLKFVTDNTRFNGVALHLLYSSVSTLKTAEPSNICCYRYVTPLSVDQEDWVGHTLTKQNTLYRLLMKIHV
ncbi:hypothetical protein C0J52_19341 [Blattella germanica]|nr:hypothetical protein C0J52_19341 [Blattella germanica]